MSILNAKLGFGTYRITEYKIMEEVLKQVFESQYDFIDTAKHYENETIIGEIYEKLSANKAVFKPALQSKIWPNDFKNGVEVELKETLKRLRIQKIDAFLLHRPHVDMSWNVKAWKELLICQAKGLVSVVGVCNFDRDQLLTLYHETGVFPALNQIEMSVTCTRYDRIIFNKKNKICLQGWRPFGNYSYTFKSPFLSEMATKYNCTVAQIMLAYSLNHQIVPVCRSAILKEIAENIEAKKIYLTPHDLVLIEQHMNTHIPSTHNGCDSFANLSLNEDWYKNN